MTRIGGRRLRHLAAGRETKANSLLFFSHLFFSVVVVGRFRCDARGIAAVRDVVRRRGADVAAGAPLHRQPRRLPAPDAPGALERRLLLRRCVYRVDFCFVSPSFLFESTCSDVFQGEGAGRLSTKSRNGGGGGFGHAPHETSAGGVAGEVYVVDVFVGETAVLPCPPPPSDPPAVITFYKDGQRVVETGSLLTSSTEFYRVFLYFFNEIKPMLRFGRTFAAAAVGQPARRGERGGRRRPLHVHGVQPHHGRGARQPARPQTGRQAGAQPTAAARLPLAARGTLHRSDRYGTRLVLQL